jgi:hypothetical protein
MTASTTMTQMMALAIVGVNDAARLCPGRPSSFRGAVNDFGRTACRQSEAAAGWP